MIDYTKPRQPSAAVAAAVLALPRLADGRISYSHPNRPALGTPPRIRMQAGDVVRLTAHGAVLVRNS